jgi:hypothetical protein
MYPPALDQFCADLQALENDDRAVPDDSGALLEEIGRLRVLAVYLNAHLSEPTIPEV